MTSTRGWTAGVLLATALVTPAVAARQAVPRSSGSASHGRSAPGRPSTPSASRQIATRSSAGAASIAARTRVSGTARYGRFRGGTVVFGDPYWGRYSPWWGYGYYGYWGWPSYGFYGYPYGYPYGYGPGYAPSFHVSGGSGDEDGVAPDTPATIITAISPSKAQVTLDGEDVGYAGDYNGTWDRLTVSPGAHTIGFSRKGYRTVIVELTAEPGRGYVFRDELARGEGERRRTVGPAGSQKVGALGKLRIAVTPDDAAIYLDGEYLGLAGELAAMHGALEVPAGSHKLEAARPGYAAESKTIDVESAGLATFSLSLEAAP